MVSSGVPAYSVASRAGWVLRTARRTSRTMTLKGRAVIGMRKAPQKARPPAVTRLPMSVPAAARPTDEADGTRKTAAMAGNMRE